jgi:uncharacterized protein
MDWQGADGQFPAPSVRLPNYSHFPERHLQIPDPEADALWVTDDLLFNHQRCQRRAFLDTFEQERSPDPPSDYLLKLRQDGMSHQIDVLGHDAVRPDYPNRDWLAGARATLELMQQGVERIAKGVLLFAQGDGLVLVSCPDLLIRQPGQSAFGDWLYVPTEIKLGKRPKLDYQIVAAFHTYLLAQTQRAWSETCWLILRHHRHYAVDLETVLPKMQEALEACIQTLRHPEAPEVFISHSRCDLCQWLSYCYEVAQEDKHLSLLPGVTPSRYAHLKELHLTTAEALAQIQPEVLAPLPGFGMPVAEKLVRQAQSTLHQRAIAHPLPPHASSGELLLSPEELPTSPIELYFDIEAAPEQNLVYLHGVLVVDRDQGLEDFYPLLADRHDDEPLIWEAFLDLVWQYPDAPIYHFCPYEVQTVQRLAERYDTPKHHVEPLLQRFVDLHERVTRVATLPVESYALKAIARWLGFNWRDADANGAQSIYWYSQWLSTGDRTFLNAIIRYNEDDCRATYRVKDWLVKFVEEESSL